MSERQVQASHFSEDIQEFLRKLDHHGVRFLLIGGEAVIFYGYPRYTGDVGFFYDRSSGNAARLFLALQEFWGGPVPAIAEASELEQDGMVFQFGRPPNRIDLLSRVAGIEFESAWASRLGAELLLGNGESREIPYLGLAEFVASKEAAGRPKDLEDVRYLRRLLG